MRVVVADELPGGGVQRISFLVHTTCVGSVAQALPTVDAILERLATDTGRDVGRPLT